MNQIAVRKKEIQASLYRDSYFDFVKGFWPVIIPEEPIWNWHIEKLCDEMQIVAERVFKGLPKAYDLLINIPPGTTKSTVCSIMFTPWIWTRMPTARSINASFTDSLAMNLSIKSRDIVRSELYVDLFGDINLREDQNTKGHYMNSKGGSRMAIGIGGSVVGYHGHFITIDDPLDPNKAISDSELKSANRYLSEIIPTRKVDKAITPTIVIKQRVHQQGPAAQMLARAKRMKIRHINLPAEIDSETRKNVHPRKYVKYYINGLLDPVRLSPEILADAREELGEYGYACQFLQKPISRGGSMFHPERILLDIFPENSYNMKVRFWDKAGTKDAGAYTVGLLMAKCTKNLYWILDIIRGRWDSATREEIIKQTAMIDGPDTIIGIEQEPGSGGKESAENTVRMLAGYKVRTDRPSGSKENRADPFSVQVNAGNVRMVQGEWNRAYLEELQYFPNSRFKDQVDSSSGAFSIITKPIIEVGGLL